MSGSGPFENPRCPVKMGMSFVGDGHQQAGVEEQVHFRISRIRSSRLSLIAATMSQFPSPLLNTHRPFLLRIGTFALTGRTSSSSVSPDYAIWHDKMAFIA